MHRVVRRERASLGLPAIIWFIHETPLESGRETGSTPASEPRLLDLPLDPLRPFQYNLLGLVPLALWR